MTPRLPTTASGNAAYAADGAADNPYAGIGTDPAFRMDADGADAPYSDYNTFAPRLGSDGLGSVPDPSRLDRTVRHDSRANLRNPWKWWEKKTGDNNDRHAAAEEVDADGFTVRQSVTHFAADPRWDVSDNPRPTGRMSPHTYSFMRPFDQSYSRKLTGEHLSMADHRRSYDVNQFGMEPVSRGRNTYRIEPKPWDNDIVDEPDNPNDGLPYQHVDQFSVPGSATSARKWSL